MLGSERPLANRQRLLERSASKFTQTQKILVRNLKKTHFDRNRLPDDSIFWRTRGDKGYRTFSVQDYEQLRETFAKAERLALLDR